MIVEGSIMYYDMIYMYNTNTIHYVHCALSIRYSHAKFNYRLADSSLPLGIFSGPRSSAACLAPFGRSGL